MKLGCKILVSVLSCALFLPALPGNTYAVSLDKMVSRELARKAAASVVIDAVNEGDSSWNKQTRIGVTEDVYDPSGQLVAYRVQYEGKNGENEGYSLISAFRDEEPVLMWTEGEPIKEEEAESAALSELQTSGHFLVEPKVKDSKLVWYGGVKIGVEVESTTGEDFAVDEGMSVFNLTASETSSKESAYPDPAYNKENREKWDWMDTVKLGSSNIGLPDPPKGVGYVDPITWEPLYHRIDKYYINGVVSQKQWTYEPMQWSGCSPTAASNIVMWFAKQYPSLNPTGNQKDIVMDLRIYMGTTQEKGEGVTQPYNISGGLQEYMRSHGVPTAYTKTVPIPTFVDYQNRIEDGAPVLQSYWNSGHFGDHTVTVVGFKEFIRAVPSSKYLVVKNNWADEPMDLYVKWGTWNANIMSYTYVNGR